MVYFLSKYKRCFKSGIKIHHGCLRSGWQSLKSSHRQLMKNTISCSDRRAGAFERRWVGKNEANTPIRSSPCLQCLRKKGIEKKVNKKYAVNKIKPKGAKMPIRGTSLSFLIKDFLDFVENLIYRVRGIHFPNLSPLLIQTNDRPGGLEICLNPLF